MVDRKVSKIFHNNTPPTFAIWRGLNHLGFNTSERASDMYVRWNVQKVRNVMHCNVARNVGAAKQAH